jgi:thiol:disulfide interchange protein DsbD
VDSRAIAGRSLAVGWVIAVVAALMRVGGADAAPVRTTHVTAELVAERQALVPGTTATVALRLAVDPGWHTYWRNPGESGLPTTLEWRLPHGYAAGDILWPAPRALPAGPLINYGYEGDTLHLVPIAVPADAKPGADATLDARADWLVCRETCIPESAELSLTLPVARDAAPDARWQRAIDATRAALPRPAPSAWAASATADGSTIKLSVATGAADDPGRLQFFANRDKQIEPSAAQVGGARDGRIELSLPVAHDAGREFQRLDGVLTAQRGFVVDGVRVVAVALDIPVAGTPVPGPRPVQADATLTAGYASSAQPLSLALAVAFALAGGLLLNLMPCVFPVLSLKALGLVASHADDRQLQRREGVAFAAGVILTFMALAAAILAVRAAGEQLGWGFQLQSPAIVSALALLFFVMALNLSGVFEFGSLVPSRIAGWTHANRTTNAFASGVLAVAIASPCTAPFMGAALGFALAESAPVTLAIFCALGIGMAFPYVALAWFPAWRRLLPRPGAWMVVLKQLLAFPLYATVAWLIWVLGAQVGNDAVMRIGGAMVLIAFALWAWRVSRSGGRAAWATAALIGAACGMALAWPLLGSERAALAAGGPKRVLAASSDGWEPYSARRVDELTAQGRRVFVDFTAAWCVTCQVNKQLVLTDSRVRDAFARADVALLRADWTRRDAAITQALTALGRSGVPVYVLYGPRGERRLLPEVLQRDTLIDAIGAS